MSEEREHMRRERAESQARMEAVVARVRGWGRELRYLYKEGLPGMPDIVAEMLAYSGEPDGGKVLLTDDLLRRLRRGQRVSLRCGDQGATAFLDGPTVAEVETAADPVKALRSVLLLLPAETEPPPPEEQTAAPLKGDGYEVTPGGQADG